MSNLRMGIEVVAIDSNVPAFEEGEVFIVRGLIEGRCEHDELLVDIGIQYPNGYGHVQCPFCGTKWIPENGRPWFSHKYFLPLDELCDISELTEHLKTTSPFEVIKINL